MIKCKHLLENRFYLLSGKTVEGTKVFKNSSEKRRFKNLVQTYLSDISQIIHLEVYYSEFHILIKLRDRSSFQKFYKSKYKSKVKEDFFIPVSTHIFGRQMSNLQVSFVKYYNWKVRRSGVLMDGRYRRHLIESEEELDQILSDLKSGKFRFPNKRNYRSGKNKKKHLREEDLEDNGDVNKVYTTILTRNIDLRGCFEPPFKKSLIPHFLAQKMKIFRINHPCGPNYN